MPATTSHNPSKSKEIGKMNKTELLYVLIMSRTHFEVNPHSIVA